MDAKVKEYDHTGQYPGKPKSKRTREYKKLLSEWKEDAKNRAPDTKIYYEGFVIIFGSAKPMAKDLDKVWLADAAHCTGPLKGMTYNIVACSANRNLVRIAFGHIMASESKETWEKIGKAVGNEFGTGFLSKITILCDGAKGLEALAPSMGAKSFRCSNHFVENVPPMGKKIFLDMTRARTPGDVEKLRKTLDEKSKNYLSKFPNDELFVAYNHEVWRHKTQSGVESENSRNKRSMIRASSPFEMIRLVLNSEKTAYNGHKSTANETQTHVPGRILALLNDIKAKSSRYSVVQAETGSTSTYNVTTIGKPGREARVTITLDNGLIYRCSCKRPSIFRFPCWHVGAVCAKEPAKYDITRFVSASETTEMMRKQYEPEFKIPDVFLSSYDRDETLQVPLITAPQTGRPKSGKRFKSQRERNPTKSTHPFEGRLVCPHKRRRRNGA